MKTLKQYIYKSILGFLALILCEVTNAQNIRLEIWPGTICSGQSATINVDFYSSFISDPPITYYFYKNGNQYTYINSSELYFEYQMPNVSQGDQIRCEVVTNGSNRYVSNTFTVQIFQPITPYVYISTYAELDDYTNQPVFCPNTNKTMVADGNGSSYQWFRNGSSVSTSRTYTPATLNNGDVIRVETKIYDQCRGIYRTASDQITADVRPDITPTATLTSNAGANICAGTSVTFTASATGVQYMSYSWLKNGQPIPGVYSSTYMATDLVNGDQIQAQVSSYESCVTQTTTQSNTLTMQIQTPQPLTVSLIGDTQVCNWDDISVYANVSIPYNQINSIEWYYNGENDTHYNVSTDPLYFKLRPGSAWENTSTVKCRITPKSGVCLTNSEVYSSDFVITLKPTEYNYVSIYSTDSEREWREGGTINEICRGGQSVTFAATALPANYNHTYTWYLNNYELPNSNKTTMTITEEMLNGYGAESVSQVKASIVTTGGCLRNIYKGSGTISLKLVNSPSAPSVTPEVSQGCMHAVLTAKLPPNQAAYWQTSATGESFINYGGSPYLVSQPGVYHLRSYGACWGAAKSVTVVANDMDGAKPMLSVQYTCNKAILKLENTLSGLTYYFQTSADSKLTTEPFTNIVSQSKTAYYVRGTDGNSWGCTSNPLAVNIVAGVNCDKNYIRERVVQNQGITSGTQITATNALTNYTYYDGLGRPEQSVAAASSPLGFDMVTPMEYDTYGRQSKQYLPYIASTVNGSYQDTAVSAQGNYYKATHVNTVKDDNPWSDTDFEPSPLNRITKQVGTGKDWQGTNWKTSGKRKLMAYSTNTATDAVRLWVASPTKVVTSKPYDAGMLYVTEMTNEDNRVTIEYKDMQDRVVRQRQLRTTGQYADTDYCYDDFGRLAFVIPPAVTKSADLTIDTVKSDPWFSKYVYAYLYDARGRVVEKHIPGAGWTSIVYNKLDLPIATQDAAQRGNNEWTFTKYDAYGRVAVTGVYTNKTNITLASVQALADGASYSQWETRTSGKNYDNAAFPDTTTSTGSIFSTIHAVNYYDSYSFTSKSFAGASKQVHGLATGSKTRVLGTETWLYTVIFYDDRGRVKHTWTEQLSQSGKVADETTYEYDFVGKITRSERKISNIQQ